jgi:tetratricopeptide (TPR) repeat protein
VNGLDTLISTVSGAIGGGITGAIAVLVSWRTLQHTVERDKAQDYFSSLKDVIASQEKAVQEAQEGSEREEAARKLAELREDLRLESKGWRDTHRPPEIVPRGAIRADAPKPLAEEVEQLRQWLANTSKAPPTLLTVGDHFIRGNAYYEAGDYQQALEAYNRALELRPDLPEALSNRGILLRRLGRYEEALRDYNRALELRPDLPEAMLNRGVALGKLRRYEEALKDENRALELRPDDPNTLANRSSTLTSLGRYDDALRDVNRALELKPGYSTALYNRACLCSLMGRFEELLRDLEAAIKGDEKYRQMAKTDEDFEKLRSDPEYGPRFRELVGEQDQPEG